MSQARSPSKSINPSVKVDWIPPAMDDDDLELPSRARPSNISRPNNSSLRKSTPPAYDPDFGDYDDLIRKSEAVEKRNSGGNIGKRAIRALSEANIKEKSDRPDRRIARMGTIRDNIHDEVITVYRPWFTFLMVVVNIGVFLYTMYAANWKLASTTENPLIGPSTSILLTLGAKYTKYILAGNWWRLMTPMFLHAGVIHLLMNMVMLKRLGQGLEEGFGFVIVASIYLMSGVSGVLASSVMNPDIVGVGASGALYGMVGALFGDFFQNHQTIVEGKWMYFFSMVISLVLGVGMGLLPVIDNWAHLGGLVCGFLMGNILLTNNMHDEKGKRLLPCYSKLLTLLSALGLIVWFVTLFGLLYGNKNAYQYCSFCKYLDCVPTPYWTCP